MKLDLGVDLSVAGWLERRVGGGVGPFWGGWFVKPGGVNLVQVCVSPVSGRRRGRDDDRGCGGWEDGNSARSTALRASSFGLRDGLRQSGRFFTARRKRH